MPRVSSARYRVDAGWDDVPHLDEQTKSELLESTPPYLRDARSKGIPSLGSGAIYPYPQESFLVEPFAIPAHWHKAYALDVAWSRTAALWGAWDRDADVIYLYSEHYLGEAEPSIHADAIKARGEWINGTIDPASRGRSQKDGEQLRQNYTDLGLDLIDAVNTVEAGIEAVRQMLAAGRIKVFRTLLNFIAEHRIYRRDDKGKIVKANDHLMDCMRYLIMMRHQIFGPPPATLTPSSSGFIVADTKGGY